METKVLKTIKEWVPQALATSVDNDYQALNELADYFMQSMMKEGEGQEGASESIQVVNLLYMNGKLHDKNAIENEFLARIAEEESPGSLKKHLQFFPKELRQAYLKTIIEN